MLDDSGDPAFKDEYGLREAYGTEDGISVHGDTMYISGTRLDRLSGLSDVLDDVTFVPLREAYNTQRYQQALAALKRSKERERFWAGHSLGGAVAAALTERFPELEARVYGAPLLRSSTSVRVPHIHARPWRNRLQKRLVAPPIPTKATNNPESLSKHIQTKRS